jgi:hypothetical protein
VWVSHFRSLDGSSPLDASASFGRWRCRHCSAAILVSRNNLLFFQHLASCIGIVSLMRSLKAILQQLVLSGSSSNNDGEQRMSDQAIAGRLSASLPLQGSGEQENDGTETGDFSAPPKPDVESVPAEPPRPGGAQGDQLTAGGARGDPEQYQCDSKNRGVVALNISTLPGASTGPGPIKPLYSFRNRDDPAQKQLGSTSGGAVTPQVTGLSQTGPGVGGPPADAGRTRAEIKEENRLFLSSNFSCSAKAIACRICDKHLFQGENCYLLHHAVSLPCLAWRVERESDRRPVASEGTCTGGGFLPRLCIDVSGTAVTSALRVYREGHFGQLAGVPPPQQDVLACRHCGSKVNRTESLHPYLYHLAVCVGVEPVIRDKKRHSQKGRRYRAALLIVVSGPSLWAATGDAPYCGRARSPDSLLLPRELCGAWIRPERRHKLRSISTGQSPFATIDPTDEPPKGRLAARVGCVRPIYEGHDADISCTRRSLKASSSLVS